MAKKTDDKPKTFNIRFRPVDWERVERIAAHHEQPMAAVIRMLLKREDDEIGAQLAARPKALRRKAG